MHYANQNYFSPHLQEKKIDNRKNWSNSPSKCFNSTADLDLSQSFNRTKISSNLCKEMKYSNNCIPHMRLSSKIAFSPITTINTIQKKPNTIILSSISSSHEVFIKLTQISKFSEIQSKNETKLLSLYSKSNKLRNSINLKIPEFKNKKPFSNTRKSSFSNQLQNLYKEHNKKFSYYLTKNDKNLKRYLLKNPVDFSESLFDLVFHS